MLKIVLASVLLSASLFAGEISVALAANLADVIEVLKREFALSHPNTKVTVILGGSGKLSTQIKNGAPFDVFLSADMGFPEVLYAQNLAVSKPVVYASGALAIMSTRGFDVSRGISIVEDVKIDKIALANPKTAPYGVATIEALKNANLYDKVSTKLVFGESISQAIQFATSASDIGFVNTSAFYGDKMKSYQKGVHWMEVDPKLYTPIAQGIVLLKQAQNNAEAKGFYDFILSPKAKKIFQNYGYIVHE